MILFIFYYQFLWVFIGLGVTVPLLLSNKLHPCLLHTILVNLHIVERGLIMCCRGQGACRQICVMGGSENEHTLAVSH